MANFLLSLAYDGGNYAGWITQPKQLTIQGSLNKAIKTITKTDQFKTLGASKTDAGVHALDQKVVLTINFEPLDLNRFKDGLNKALPNDIHITAITKVNDDYNLHQQVIEKTYSYRIAKNWSLERQRYRLVWTNRWDLKAKDLNDWAQTFIGNHNFQNYSGLSQAEIASQPNLVQRQINSFQVFESNDEIVFLIKGPGFIRYQIRMMVGALLAVAQDHKYSPNDLLNHLNDSSIKKFPKVAPAEGLCLEEIKLAGTNHIND